MQARCLSVAHGILTTVTPQAQQFTRRMQYQSNRKKPSSRMKWKGPVRCHRALSSTPPLRLQRSRQTDLVAAEAST